MRNIVGREKKKMPLHFKRKVVCSFVCEITKQSYSGMTQIAVGMLPMRHGNRHLSKSSQRIRNTIKGDGERMRKGSM